MYSEGKKGYIQSNACRQNRIIKHPNWTYQSTVTPLNSNWELFGCYIWDSFQCTYWGHYNNSVFVVFMHVCTTPIHTMFVAVVCLFQNRQCEQNTWRDWCVCVSTVKVTKALVSKFRHFCWSATQFTSLKWTRDILYRKPAWFQVFNTNTI